MQNHSFLKRIGKELYILAYAYIYQGSDYNSSIWTKIIP